MRTTFRSRPLPASEERDVPTQNDHGLNLTNIIDDLMRNPE